MIKENQKNAKKQLHVILADFTNRPKLTGTIKVLKWNLLYILISTNVAKLNLNSIHLRHYHLADFHFRVEYNCR